jgi:hypothetical protein
MFFQRISSVLCVPAALTELQLAAAAGWQLSAPEAVRDSMKCGIRK